MDRVIIAQQDVEKLRGRTQLKGNGHSACPSRLGCNFQSFTTYIHAFISVCGISMCNVHMCTYVYRYMCMYACGNQVNECLLLSLPTLSPFRIYFFSVCREVAGGTCMLQQHTEGEQRTLGESIFSSHHVSHYQSPDMSFLSAMRQDNLLHCRILAMMFCLTTA